MRVVKCKDFSREHDHAAFSVVRVFNGRLAELGGRGAWITISSENRKVYRRVMGSGSVGLTQDAIELDYDSRHDLGITSPPDQNGFHPCDLKLKRSTTLERIAAHWTHPNLAYQVPYRLAMLSLALGLIGLLLGVVSLIG